MATQQQFPTQKNKTDGSNLFALLFFFMGAPHIYGFLTGRSRRKTETPESSSSFALTIASLLGTGLVGTLALGTF